MVGVGDLKPVGHTEAVKTLMVSVKPLVAVVTSIALLVGVPTIAAAHEPKPKKLVLYSENVALDLVDTSKPGIDHGDLFHRKLNLSKTRGGKVIGVGYTQGEVIAFDDKRDIRRVHLQAFLPGGTIFLTGTSDLPIGTTPNPGWVNTYAITGGTGKYAGATGTMTAVLLTDGKSFKNTLRYRQ
jgi:hypothetical protein